MDDTLVQLALTFIKLSLLSFGDGVTILPEMEREAVQHAWMTQAQFAEAYALSRITPGSSNVVLAVGYHAAGLQGAMVAAAAFFVPTTLLVLLTTSVWRHIRTNPWPTAIRIALTPVALGLIIAALYTISRSTVRDVPTLLIIVGASFALLRTNVTTPAVLAVSTILGAVFLRP